MARTSYPLPLEAVLRQLEKLHAGVQRVEGHREDDGTHLLSQHHLEAAQEGRRAPETEVVARLEGRREEGKALDVVPVGVAEEDVAVDRTPVRSGHQGTAQLANAGAGVEDDERGRRRFAPRRRWCCPRSGPWPGPAPGQEPRVPQKRRRMGQCLASDGPAGRSDGMRRGGPVPADASATRVKRPPRHTRAWASCCSAGRFATEMRRRSTRMKP